MDGLIRWMEGGAMKGYKSRNKTEVRRKLNV